MVILCTDPFAFKSGWPRLLTEGIGRTAVLFNLTETHPAPSPPNTASSHRMLLLLTSVDAYESDMPSVSE
jgi:hypothetical protein